MSALIGLIGGNEGLFRNLFRSKTVVLPTDNSGINKKVARKLSDKEKKGLQEEVLARLVDKVIIMQEAQKRKISVTDKEIDQYIREKFKSNKKLQDNYLKERSLTLQDYREVVRYQKIREKLYDIVTKNYKYEDKPIQFTKYLNELKKNAEIEVYVKFE